MKRVFSNALRNDLQHPNEYIRGATLRFLCKIREAEVLEPLIASVRACLVKEKDQRSVSLHLMYWCWSCQIGTSSFLCAKKRCFCNWIYLSPLWFLIPWCSRSYPNLLGYCEWNNTIHANQYHLKILTSFAGSRHVLSAQCICRSLQYRPPSRRWLSTTSSSQRPYFWWTTPARGVGVDSQRQQSKLCTQECLHSMRLWTTYSCFSLCQVWGSKHSDGPYLQPSSRQRYLSFFHNWLLLSETNILSSCCHLLYRACCKGIWQQCQIDCFGSSRKSAVQARTYARWSCYGRFAGFVKVKLCILILPWIIQILSIPIALTLTSDEMLCASLWVWFLPEMFRK